MKSEDAVAEYIRRVASQGGKARAKSLNAKQRKEIARRAARARWRKKRRKSKSRVREKK
jgi:hypothetical protein